MKIDNNAKYVFKSKDDGLFWPGERDIVKAPSFSGIDIKQICKEDRGMKTEFVLVKLKI